MWSALDNDNNEVSDEVMERYKHMVAATEYTSLSRMGYENCIIEGMKPFTPGRKLVSARAHATVSSNQAGPGCRGTRGRAGNGEGRTHPDSPGFAAYHIAVTCYMISGPCCGFGPAPV